MNKEIKEIIDSLEQTVSWCDRITTGNLPHKIGNLKHGLFNIIELLKVLNLGWHPVSELPTKDGEYIVICEGFEMCPFRATFDTYINDWSHNDVKWWSYPPSD